MNKATKTFIGIACIGVSALVLTACGKQSPLKTEPQEKVAKFVMHASQYAEKKMGFNHERGMQYGQCMSGEKAMTVGLVKPQEVDCGALYKSMVEFAKKDPVFKGVSELALMDKQSFSRFKEFYERDVFNNI